MLGNKSGLAGGARQVSYPLYFCSGLPIGFAVSEDIFTRKETALLSSQFYSYSPNESIFS